MKVCPKVPILVATSITDTDRPIYPDVDHPALTIEAMLCIYANYLVEHGRGADTVSQRVRFARHRWADWGTWEPARADVGRWLSQFDGWTKVTYYSHLNSLYGWLVADGLVTSNPMDMIRRPPQPRPRPRPLTENELRRALETAGPDVRSWLMLGYLAGLRRFEIAKFRGEDITEDGIYVLGKGGQAWTVPTHPLLWDLAQFYPRDGYWFPSPHCHERAGMPVTAATVGNKVSGHFRSLGLTGSTHRARHTYGTRLLRGGANLRVVQELMRHSSLATTAMYLGVDHDEKVHAIRGLAA